MGGYGKSAGNVKFEFDTETEKATNPVGHIKLVGTETFIKLNTETNWTQFGIDVGAKATPNNVVGNVICDKFITYSGDNIYSQKVNGISLDNNGRIRIELIQTHCLHKHKTLLKLGWQAIILILTMNLQSLLLQI